MPPFQNSHSRPTAFSSNVLFWHLSTTTDIQHVYQLLTGWRHIQDNYTTFVLLQQMVVWQEEESDRWLQHEQNELALLWEFAEAAFEEACTNGLDTILQPVIHLWEERNHRHYHRTGLSPPMIPSDSSSLPPPIQWPRQQPNISPITSYHCETRRVGKNNPKHRNELILTKKVVFRKGGNLPPFCIGRNSTD